ncbi:MAG: Crp/Fnr family transcriptional regulator [Clostridia bacterium]|nr:Crp/Fnr family transcriptional regulator [Clostridia bacterium]
MSEYINILSKSQLFKNMTVAEVETALECGMSSVKKYPKGVRIISQGDKLNVLCMILSGSAVISRDDFWGNSTVISKLTPPMCFGLSYALSAEGISGVDVTAQEDVTIMYFDTGKMLSFSNSDINSRIIQNLIAVIASKNAELSEKIEHISQRKLRDKILSYLSYMSKRENSDTFDIPFSRKQLADYLCADRSALSNELCKLRDEGVIKFHKNHFEIL